MSRPPFEEAKKKLRFSWMPRGVQRKLAQHLDLDNHANWVYLAEALDIEPQEIRWIQSKVKNSSEGSSTLRLFDDHLIPHDISLETFEQALDTIKNHACIHILEEQFNNGAFDQVLRKMSNGYNKSALQENSLKSNCHSFSSHSTNHSIEKSPLRSSDRTYRSADHPENGDILSKINSFVLPSSSDGDISSGSTYGSTDAMAGDMMHCYHLDSTESVQLPFKVEYPGGFTEVCSRTEYNLSSINDFEEQRMNSFSKSCREQDGHNQPDSMALDLSKPCNIKKECWELESYREAIRDNKPNDQKYYNGHACGHRFERDCRFRQCCASKKQNGCMGCCEAGGIKIEKKELDSEKSTLVKNQPKVMKKERNMNVENREQHYNIGNNFLCCSSSAKTSLHQQNGCVKALPSIEAAQANGSLNRRFTHPPSDTRVNSDEHSKKNPDGTSPVRTVGSSYGVIQQMPFKKDARSVRVFVTYAEDSKSHMKKVMQLCDCLKKNDFSVSIDIRENDLVSQDKMGWFDKRYKVADYVLVLISPKYFDDVTGMDDCDVTQKKDSTLNTLYIHRCMQAEYMMNHCINKRFVPVLMPGSTREHIPVWLRNTTIYCWPEQYKNLFFYMLYPAQVISDFMLRERSTRAPIVQKKNC